MSDIDGILTRINNVSQNPLQGSITINQIINQHTYITILFIKVYERRNPSGLPSCISGN